jgi:cytochrome c5
MFSQTNRLLLVLSASAVAAISFAGCAADLGECPTDSATQETAGMAVVNNTCAKAGCHTSANGGNPADGLDFSSASVVKDNASEMYGEVEAGVMPPTGKLNGADIEALRVYLACMQ